MAEIVEVAHTDLLNGLLEVNTATGALDGLAVITASSALPFDGRLLIPMAVPLFVSAWLDTAPAPQWSGTGKEIFVCVLRLAPLDDLEVPMASMQLRRRNGNPTMLSCIVPDAMAYYTAAAARDGGEIIIYGGVETEAGVRQISEIERATLEGISYDVGVMSSSLTLSGYRTATTANPREVALSGISYYGLQADGKQRVRSKPNIFLRPGDTVTFQGGAFVVDQIYLSVEAKNAWMEASGL
jgi:hypothetical protein